MAKGLCSKHYMRRYRDTGTGGWIELHKTFPVFNRLIAIYGNKSEVAKALNIPRQGFLAPRKKYIQQRTFDRAMELLKEHEAELANTNYPLEVVSADALSQILRAWSVTWLKEHPPVETFGKNTMRTGPSQVIADRSGLNVRTVSRWINNELKAVHVDAYVADKLLDAIDDTNALIDGRLTVIPNPALSMETWVKRMSARGCI